MSAQIFAHPRHVEQLGGYRLAHYWLDRGFETRPTDSLKFVTLVRSNKPEPTLIVRLFKPNIQRIFR